MTEKQMKTLRYHAYGEPLAVLNLETTTIPVPQANHIRIQVKACALTTWDWDRRCRNCYRCWPPSNRYSAGGCCLR